MNPAIVYQATSPSGKIYFGKTIQALNERKYKHYSEARRGVQCHFARALRKYGEEMIFEQLFECPTDKQARDLEKILIAAFDTRNSKIGYNETKGGDGAAGAKRSPATRELMAASKRGKPRSEETKQKLRLARTGSRHTEESKKQMSLTRSGKPHPGGGRKTPVLCVETGKKYCSAIAAQRKTEIDSSCIVKVCKHKPRYKTAGGFHWQYVNLKDIV